MMAARAGKQFDEGGKLAASGNIQPELLHILNTLEYYQLPFPKSLSNDFGTQVVYPMLKNAGFNIHDTLRTYVEHIAMQVSNAIRMLKTDAGQTSKLLVTGGGAHNDFLIERIRMMVQPIGIELVVPDKQLVDFKEAIIMALIGVLRWREENNALATVTGAERDSIGGAVWIGQEA
jgi:anhydro-N-acetylmuramic acid kinase